MRSATWLRALTRVAYRPLTLTLLLLIMLLGIRGTDSPVGIPTTHANGIFAATIDSNGHYEVVLPHLGWTFGGSVGTSVKSFATATGSDRLGAYQSLYFAYNSNGQRLSSIRTYINRPVVLFSTTYLASAPNVSPFPTLSNYPQLPFRLGYNGSFARYSFQKSGDDSPWFSFNQQRQTFAFSPATNFLTASTRQDTGSLVSGISPTILRLPAGLTQWTMLVAGDGINNIIDTWGQALTDFYGKVRRANDSDVTLNTLGYWTDNGAAYYYQFEPKLGYAGTLLTVKDYLASLGINIGYMQLDSWWYPKGPTATWQGSGKLRGGIYAYAADPTLFPSGLAAFHQALGLPLVTHARWIDPSSPYHQEYKTSNNVVIDPTYWNSIMTYLRSAGVVTYEQDWLSGPATTANNLGDPQAFLTNMASASAVNGLTLQYCLATPGDFLQSVEYGNVITMRVSRDHFGRSRWNEFLYGSRLASAVGAWPWTDVFNSGETSNLLLSTLSAGMVGIGDRIGTTNAPNLLQAVRSDGVIVKPDAPIVPTDESYILGAELPSAPVIASTYTQHGDQLARYVFAYAQGSSAPISFSPADLGVSGPSYVYDYFSKQGRVLPAGGTYSQTVTYDGAYYVVVPIGKSGIGFLGDAGEFVSLGKKRISALSDDGVVRATVLFAANEHTQQLFGYAPASPEIVATDGAVLSQSYNPVTHLFDLVIAPGLSGTAKLELFPVPSM